MVSFILNIINLITRAKKTHVYANGDLLGFT